MVRCVNAGSRADQVFEDQQIIEPGDRIITINGFACDSSSVLEVVSISCVLKDDQFSHACLYHITDIANFSHTNHYEIGEKAWAGHVRSRITS